MATLGEYNGAGSGITKALYHLNGSSADSSGNGNNGTDNEVTYGAGYGKYGKGVSFNITNTDSKRITVADNASLDINYITVSAWINLQSNPVTWAMPIMARDGARVGPAMIFYF